MSKDKTTIKTATSNPKLFGTGQQQPSPQAKSAGWERKRIAQQIMDKILFYQDMPIDQFNKVIQDMEDHPENYTAHDKLAYNYAKAALDDPKYTVDYLNRHVPYAPQKSEIGSDPDGGPLQINIVRYDKP